MTISIHHLELYDKAYNSYTADASDDDRNMYHYPDEEYNVKGRQKTPFKN